APAEEDFSRLPIEDRLKHKAWKARVSAYEELSKSFSTSAYDTDPIFKPYVRNPDLVKAMVVDSNVVAQEKAVTAVCDFVRYGGKAAGGTRETVLPAVVEKCLGSTRGGTKKAAIELVSLYAEAEDVMGCSGLVDDVLGGLSAKQPKVVSGCVAALTALVRDFGPKQVVPKPILKRLPDVFAHSDKTVRAEGAQLAVELHRYLGAALEPTIDSLKDIQAKELRAQFQQIDEQGQGKPTPTRHLFSQKAAAEAAAAAAAAPQGAAQGGGSSAQSGMDDGGAADGAADFDAYEMAEAVDPLKAKAWPSSFDEQVKSAKWSERKEAFEAAKTVLTSNVKLQPTNAFDFFVDACVERVKKDATVHVWLTACQCLEAAAKGMRGGFGKYRDRTVPPLLEKLKEKKQSTVDVLASTLDAIFQTVTLSEVLEDILTATKHKNPNVKTESIRFLVRCLRTTKTPPAKGDIKPVADALLAACSDGSGDVRDAGTQGLGTLMKLIGERPMNPYLDQLDDIKKGKVQEEFAKATVKVRMGGAAPPAARSAAPPAAAAAPKPQPRVVARSSADKENAPPAAKPTSMAAPPRGPPSRLAAKPGPSIAKPAAAAAPAARAAPPRAAAASASAAGAPSVNEPVKFRFTPDDAESRAADLIPSEISGQLANSNWKERLAGIQAFHSWLDREAEALESELIVRALGKKPGWKESNFQVFAEVFKVFRLLAEQCPTFGRASVALSVQPLCDKLGDIKLKVPAGETLTTYSERTSFGFVLKQALVPLAALKAPKAVADSLLWVDAALLEFGIAGVDVKSLVAHLLTCLKSANAAVRNNATTVMGTLARFLGATLNSFLSDLNPQLKATIEAEIEKAASNPPPAPTRFGAELKKPEGAGGAGGAASAADAAAAAAAEEDALDALVPRVDIDRLIPSSALTNMGDANWKVRKESLEEIQSILQANTRLKGTLSDLAPVIKLRYSDSNIMCKQLALDIATRLATGLGKGFEPQARNFVPPVAQCLADAKAPLRQAAATTLTAIADAAGVPSMIGGFASVLDGKGANPQLKQDLFAWLAARFEAHPPDKSCDLAPLAIHAVHCLDDKLAAVKKAALATLPYIIQRAGYKFVMAQSDGMKAASKNTVQPLIDQARQAANALKAPAVAAAAPAPGAAPATRPAAAKTPAVRSLASAARPASPAMRSASPSPAASPRTSAGTSRIAGVRPPSAATRTLQAPGSRIVAPAGSAAAKPGFSSRLGVAKKAVMASSGGAAAASSFSSSAGSGSAPLLTSDTKHKVGREKREGRGGWINAEGAARPELVDALRSQCENHLGGSLLDSMFSRDHNAERDYLSALALLSDFVSSPTFAEEEYGIPQQEAVARVVANSDLILKYIAIRLTDNNTSISLKCFDVLGHLVDLLRTEQYHMSDYEAASILPCLTAKFGDAKVAFRDRIRDTFRKLTFIYPPSKLMTQYLESGLPSKNARTRAECLGELGYLFSKNGLQVCTPAKTLPVIAKSISDRDTNVRTAALLALGECYKIVGDEVWGLVGKMPDKEMSLLEERLKRTTVSKPAAGGGTAAAGVGVSSPRAIPRPTTTTTRIASGIPAPGTKSRLPSTSASSKLAAAVREPSTVDAAAEEAPDELPGKDTVQEEAEATRIEEDEAGEPDIEQAISEILSSEPTRSTQALKAIHHEMQADAAPFAPSADQLASVLAKQFSRAFGKNATNEGANARLRKYLIQVASTLFDSKMRSRQGHTVASFIEKKSLGALMTQLLQRLIDTSLQAKHDEEARTYATYLNKVVIRCFGSCNLNVLYDTSFTMLGDATEDLRDLSGATLETRFRFAELIIKCLWKVGRRLPTSLQEGTVEPAELLVVLEAFLQRIPAAEWKARARDEVKLADLPLRTVKVVLSHFVTALGEDVLSHLDKLEEPEGAEIYRILVRMINQSGEGEGEEGEGEGESDDEQPAPSSSTPTTGLNGNGHGHGHGQVATNSSSSSSPHLASSSTTGSSDADSAANAQLKDIFERISQKEQSRQAIKDLYDFQKRFPAKQPHIERSLQSTGPIFQRYIKRALANHKAEDEE
ncbi:ARM repeat-containing protein, partial [Jaminaea rosea]